MTAPAVRLIAIYDTMFIKYAAAPSNRLGGCCVARYTAMCDGGGDGEGVVEATNEYGTNEKKVPCIIIIRQGRVPYVWVGQSM